MFRFNSRRDKLPFGAVRTADTVWFSFGVRKDVANPVVTLFVRGRVRTEHYTLTYAEEDENYRTFTCSICLNKPGVYYYRFTVQDGDHTHFIGRDGMGNAINGDFLPEWQLTVYDRAFVAPYRWGGDIVYHIFVDRFCRVGELPESLEYGVLRDWEDDVTVVDPDGVYRANDFFGGNLQGIISKLDYLQELGVTLLYLSPIFVSHSNHRYDTADYSHIDPLVGTENDFAELVGKARIRGMRVMLDGVFNHTGSDSIYFNKDGSFDSFGAVQGTASPYRDWYNIRNDGSYDCWWGIQNVPTLNKKSKSVHRYLFGENGPVAHWSRYDIDWRLDVVDELPDDYLDKLRCCVKIANPHSAVIGEVWEDATTKEAYGVKRQYFTKGQLDGVMNYVFKHAILDYCTSGDEGRFARVVMDLVENYPRQCLDNCLTLIDSHDTVRALNVLAGVNSYGWSKKQQVEYRLPAAARRKGLDRLMVAATLQYMLPGMPSVFYGDEVGVQGFGDPICRRSFPWNNINEDLLEFYKVLGRVRGSLAESLAGSIRFANQNGLLVMLRGEGSKEVAVVANTTAQPKSVRVYDVCEDKLTGQIYRGDVFVPCDRVMVLAPIREDLA